MEGEEVTSQDLVRVASGQVLSGPDDDIYDVIIDWIISQARKVIDAVIKWVSMAWEAIQETVSEWVSWAVKTIENWVDNAIYWARRAYDWIHDVYHLLEDWVEDAWDTIRSAVSSVIDKVWTWIGYAVDDITRWITEKVEKVNTWISTAVSNITSTISAWFTETWSRLAAAGADIVQNIANWITNLTASIGSFFADLWGKLEATWTWLTIWMTENIVEPMNAWWDSFLGRLFDFGAWVGGLLDAIWAWLSVDIPGSSPRWEDLLRRIVGGIPLLLYDIWSRVFKEGPPAIPSILIENLQWLGDIFGSVVETFMGAVEGFIATLGPTNPDIATDHYRSLASIGMTALGGLAGMTLAGSWLKPLGGAGMGQIAAMIYDMTNYKVITGAAITALTMAAIRTPLTYHFNELFRPFILPNRDFFELMSRKAWTDPESLQEPGLTTSVMALTQGAGEAYERRTIGYYGYPDVYHGIFKELANAPLRYFPLAGIARTGFFEKVWFTEALHRSGYSKTAVDALMVMYKKMVDENVQGSMSGAAVKRFKEGLTTEEQFSGELMMLGYSDDQIPKYMAAAKMDYAYDYIMDLVSAYRDAVRKGNLSIDEYRGSLLNLGLVPERVEGYVYRERARSRPKEALTPIGPPGEIYLTDEGRIITETIRRKRQKELITRDQEIASLLSLGIPVSYAEALADNDDIRLAEKEVIEPEKIIPEYETDAGKVKVDTIRRERRKLLITRAQEVERLSALEMPDWLTEAIASNDDVRLAEKGAEE